MFSTTSPDSSASMLSRASPFARTSGPDGVPPLTTVVQLEKALDDAQQTLDLYLVNKIKSARSFTFANHKNSFHHAAVHSLVRAFEALISMRKEDIVRAQNVAFRGAELCERERAKSSPTARAVVFSKLTDAQMHAELCHAECNLAKALLNILADDSGLVGLTKAAVALKRVQLGYSLCRQMLDRGKFASQKSRDNFAVGVLLGLGAVNLFLGSAPEKVVRLVDVNAGTSKFNAETGRTLLQKAFETKGTVRTNICGIVLLVYYMYIHFIWGVGPVPFAAIDPVVDHFADAYPDGAVTHFLKGKRLQLGGHFVDSNKAFQASIAAVPDLPGFQDASNWELMFNHLLAGDYKQGVKMADLLLKRCAWSKCTFAYFKAIMMMADNQAVEAVRSVMKTVPLLKKPYAGAKFLPTENFFEHKANRYLAQGSRLTLPVEEQIYLWRGFLLIRGSKERLDEIDASVAAAEKSLKNSTIDNSDNQAVVKLVRAAVLRARGDDKAAVAGFEAAAKSRVVNEQYVVPFATFELALLDLKNGHVANALTLIKRALAHKQRHMLEVRLQFRADAATRLLGEVTKKTARKSAVTG